MSVEISGLHHVTAICGDPNENAQFYVGTLGLRLVKQTVNHDDPTTLHLYYGDAAGTPGTNITFFPWPTTRPPGRMGAGQTSHTAYLIPPESLDYWAQRLESKGVKFQRTQRFDNPVLQFEDPDGIGLELVGDEAAEDADTVAWKQGPVPQQHQLRGFRSVTLQLATPGPTAEILQDVMGYQKVGEDGEHLRFQATGSGPHSVIDIVKTDNARGRISIGSVHHVAFTVTDEDQQQRVRELLMGFGLTATESIDRIYFKSVYCREPGGVLFEFATPSPGFTRDESVEELGTNFVLPDWFEDQRDEIEEAVPALEPPTTFVD